MMILSAQQLDEAEKALREGRVIVYPTETSYALGCDATNDEAVARIFAIKGRDEGKGLPLLIPSTVYAQDVIEMTDVFYDVSKRFWPGALNIIGKRLASTLVSIRCSQNETQSVRVSSHPFASSLAKRLGKPITATSANISGHDAMYSVQDVENVFSESMDKPDLVIDAGQLPITPASTTVDISGKEVRIIRQGSVTL